MDLTAPTFGLVNGRPLFLDLAADSYFLLEPDDENQLLGALLSNPSHHPQPVNWPRPASQLSLARDASRPRLGDIVLTGASLSSVRRGLRRGALASLVSDIFQPIAKSVENEPDAIGFAMRFLSARRWLPHQAHCLTDSLALLLYLRRYGASAALIFGAKLDPFAAHCWLQAGTTLLNDRLDRIEGFTPVAALSP